MRTGPQQKQLRSVHGSTGSHWVGDGFPVRTLFAYPELGARLSPFLLLDYEDRFRNVPFIGHKV